jgi:hypothetical protein
MTHTRLPIQQEKQLAPSSSGSVSAEPTVSLLARETGALPPIGYAIATLSDGRFLPLTIVPSAYEETLAFALCKLSRHTDPVPPAEGFWPSSGPIICSTYDEALWWCQRQDETARLLRAVRAVTLRSECYPDRNVFYKEEIEHLLREAGYCWPGLLESGDGEKRDTESNGPFCIVEAQDHSRLLAWLEITVQAESWESHAGIDTQLVDDAVALMWGYEENHHHCSILNLHVEAANLDELWVRLYEAVSTIIDRKCTKESRG